MFNVAIPSVYRFSFRKGLPKKSASTPLFRLRYDKNRFFKTQIAIVVGKRVDKRAVIRNKIKRRFSSALQGILKEYQVENYSLVFFVNKDAADAQIADITQSLVATLQKNWSNIKIMGIGTIFTAIFFNPITNLLVLCYQVLHFVHLPYALGFSIILLTVLIRIVLYPFVNTQIRSSVEMQKLSPKIAAIRDKFKSDARKQQEETMKLYKEHGVNPASGCLPSLVQIPVIWSLYHALTTVVAADSLAKIREINNALYSPALKIQQIWDVTFFGVALSQSPSKLFGAHPWVVLVPVATGLFQFLLSKMMIPLTSGKVKPKGNDFQSTFQSQSVFIFPVMIGFFSFTLPFGLSLYWNTFTIFGILQQYRLMGWGSLEPWVQKVQAYGR